MARFTIRPALPADLPALPGIEKAAAQQFLSVGLNTAAKAPALGLHTFRASLDLGLLWVIADDDDNPVGFALAYPLDGALHLAEIDVHPEFSRQGLGNQLLERVSEDARARGFPAITLTTYRDVPWNAPFYARHGFEPVLDEALTPGLREILDREAQQGLMIAPRVVMRKSLA